MDLTELVPSPTLLHWIQDEISLLNWNHPLVVEYLNQNQEYRPKVALSLLCYAFCTQVFASREIVSRCSSERAFGLLCDFQPPFHFELIRFRRRNRQLIVEVISRVLVRILSEHPERIAQPADLQRTAEEIAMARLDTARHMDAADD